MTNRLLRRLPLLFALLVVCSVLLSCTTPQKQPGEGLTGLDYLRAVGDVAVRIDGTAALKRYAPEAIALLDQPVRDASGAVVGPPDGVITLAEVEAVVTAAQDPAQLTWLVLMVRGVIEARGS